MNLRIILCFAVVASSVSALDITDLNGKVYRNAEILFKNPKDLYVSYDDGNGRRVTHIPFNILSKDLQTRYDYSPDKEEEYKQAVLDRRNAFAQQQMKAAQEAKATAAKEVHVRPATAAKQNTNAKTRVVRNPASQRSLVVQPVKHKQYNQQVVKPALSTFADQQAMLWAELEQLKKQQAEAAKLEEERREQERKNAEEAQKAHEKYVLKVQKKNQLIRRQNYLSRQQQNSEKVRQTAIPAP